MWAERLGIWLLGLPAILAVRHGTHSTTPAKQSFLYIFWTAGIDPWYSCVDHMCYHHRRRINKEGKAKVVAAV